MSSHYTVLPEYRYCIKLNFWYDNIRDIIMDIGHSTVVLFSNLYIPHMQYCIRLLTLENSIRITFGTIQYTGRPAFKKSMLSKQCARWRIHSKSYFSLVIVQGNRSLPHGRDLLEVLSAVQSSSQRCTVAVLHLLVLWTVMYCQYW